VRRALKVIREIEDRGGRLEVRGNGGLWVEPRSTLTNELRQEVRTHLSAIVALLSVREVFPEARVVGVVDLTPGVA